MPSEVSAITFSVIEALPDAKIGNPFARRRRVGRAPTRSQPSRRAPCRFKGTINGYGERTGNCNLTTVIPNLVLKLKRKFDPAIESETSLRTLCVRGRFGQHAAQRPRSVRGVCLVRSQGRHPCQRRSEKCQPTNTSIRTSSAINSASSFRSFRPQQRARQSAGAGIPFRQG